MREQRTDPLVHEYAIPGGVIRLGSDARGDLCALSLRDHEGRELLNAPGPFVLADNLPVRADAITPEAIHFSGRGVRGEIHTADQRFRTLLCNEDDQPLAIRFEAPVLSYACSPSTRIFNPDIGGNLSPRGQSIQSTYPAEATICALLYTEFESPSFGFGYLNREQMRTTLENGPMLGCGRMRAVFEHLPIAGGEARELPPFYISVGREWDDLLAPYTEYAEAFPSRTGTPSWVHDTPWIFRDLPVHPFDMSRLDELMRAIDDGCRYAEARNAAPVFWMTPWWKTCERLHGKWYFDHVQGDFTEAPELVERVVEEVHRRGARIVAYTNVTALGEYSDLFQERADQVLLRPHYGSYVRNYEYPMFVYCPASRDTREQWRRIVDFMIGTLRLDGMFLDQAGGGYKAQDCHDTGHGHAPGAGYGEGLLGLMEQIRTQAKAINPDAVIFGELAQDARDHLMDFWLWHWGWSGVVGQSAYSEGAAFFKHVVPEAVLLDQENFQYPDEAEVIRAVSHGVWINGYDKQAVTDVTTGGWEYYREHRELLQTRPRPLRTDSPDVSALLFGPVDGVALVGLLQPREANETVGVWLPTEFAPELEAIRWRPLGGRQHVTLCRGAEGETSVPLGEGGELLEVRLPTRQPETG